MTRIEFTVVGEPIAQPRAKATSFGGKSRLYTPQGKVQPYKAMIAMAAQQAYQGPLLDEPLRMTCIFVFARPGRLIWKRRPMPRCFHSARPDFDNCAKAVADALTNVVWRDDSLLAQVRVSKVYAAGDEQPHTSITIETIT